MKNKNKKVIIASSLLATIALASTGFASWVITQGDSKTADGTVKVEEVENSSHKLTVALHEGNSSVVTYGTVAAPADKTPWLTNTTIGAENLVIVYDVTCTNYTAGCVSADLTATAGYATAVSHNYVGALPTATISDWTVDSGTKVGSATITLTFTWGSAFGNENPITYYNSQTYTDALAEQAKTNLNGLYEDLNGVTYLLTVTATA